MPKYEIKIPSISTKNTIKNCVECKFSYKEMEGSVDFLCICLFNDKLYSYKEDTKRPAGCPLKEIKTTAKTKAPTTNKGATK